MVSQLQGLRGVVCAFAFIAALPAQITPRPIPERWPLVRSYLGLSGTQVDALEEVSRPYWSATGVLRKRREELKSEIFAETARSPLRPEEIGRLHAEWETIRREYSALGNGRKAATRAILNDAQREKLRTFDEVAAPQGIIRELASAGFSPSGNLPTLFPLISSIPDWSIRPDEVTGPPSGKFGNGGLAIRFLQLTEAQQNRILSNGIQALTDDPTGRLRAVLAELQEELRKESLDPMALGVRFAEVESLRRKMGELRASLVARNREVLTPAQQGKLDSLVAAARLLRQRNPQSRWDCLVPAVSSSSATSPIPRGFPASISAIAPTSRR